MKVIDLFLMENKPNKIKVDGLEYKKGFCHDCNGKEYIDYVYSDPKTKISRFFWARYLFTKQTAIVEVIEEDKEIELIPIKDFNISYNLGFIDYKNIEVLKNHLNKDFQQIFDTLDLLIENQKILEKAVNELKKEGK